MQLQTKDYGVIDYEEKDLFHFSDGLFGFSQVQHYLPLCLNEEEDSTVLLLHGVEDPNIAFVVINPFALAPDYTPSLINPENHKGMQVILESSGYDDKHKLGSFTHLQAEKAAV